MKIYEYKAGKVNIKHIKDYAFSSNKYKLMKDIHNLLLSISLISIALSVVIALSIISVMIYGTSILLSVFIDAVSIFSSFGVITFFWSRYKRDVSV
ncbi:MAG: hypothetical protein CSMARM5_0121 [Candidatus Parvarchaeum acidophilus ARMAN-5_'5-way FS']|jgi:uncharacterized membrane protein|uniref:Uncharacterized protein n=1 Tax=Candidatus Parvarchaeum acidophilus ARMAN-5_'5-way FS' TaxID=994838 RepID=F2UU23_PARA5|nr:MAG: hypothetical protein CSMARM5_0121 [Candidatus Parvarchaeum acidophilus ARMAN-5_'5-way FS']